jgi:hypothetical protein
MQFASGRQAHRPPCKWEERGKRADELIQAIGPMFEGIKGMAKSAGRDPSALALIVRANVEIHNTPIQTERVDFTGALEQIADDVKTTEKLGAAEIVFDAQFSPGVETASDIVARMEDLWRIAQQA